MDRRDHIGFELRLIHNLIGESMKSKREADGICLTQLQHLIIRYLMENERDEVYQKNLEEMLHTSRATISNTLQVMERNGLVRRETAKQDARLKKLVLTDKAREISRKAKENVEEMEQLLRKDLSEEEAQLLLSMLRRIRENLIQNANEGKNNE